MPQPVDIQTELARVSAAERIQQISDRVSLAAQQRVAAATQEDRLARETQVQETPHSQSEQVDAEARRRNPFVGRKRRRKKAEESAASHGPGRTNGEQHRLDVTV